MRICSRLMVLSFFFFCSFTFVTPWCLGGELIAPTRALQDPGKPAGKLTVVSEPADLDVVLDGNNVGKTPLWLKEVTPGLHTLQVSKSKTEIQVEHGKILQVSLFKGSFVNIMKEEEKLQKKQGPEEKSLTEAGKTLESPKAEKEKGLTPWEQFINRSSRHF